MFLVVTTLESLEPESTQLRPADPDPALGNTYGNQLAPSLKLEAMASTAAWTVNQDLTNGRPVASSQIVFCSCCTVVPGYLA
jgi:hypothetical protein